MWTVLAGPGGVLLPFSSRHLLRNGVLALAPDGVTDLIEQCPGALFHWVASLGLDFHGHVFHSYA